VIRVQSIEKHYRGAAAPTLRGVSFEVPRGELAAVLGMSGAGKSTLLRCLCGLESFDRGTIAVEDLIIQGGATSPAALRGRVGLVFQSLELFPHLSVLDNCTLAPVRVKRTAKPAAEKLALELLDQLGLADKAAAWPDHLSGGQRQRVAIARALAMEPRVLLYDEPTSALDPSLKREVAETLKRVRATGVTQVVVTHDVWLAREAAEQICVLDAGRIVESGPPARVFDLPEADATKRLLVGG
jgi:ABC-type polar amino acid transport system ATPase subunit